MNRRAALLAPLVAALALGVAACSSPEPEEEPEASAPATQEEEEPEEEFSRSINVAALPISEMAPVWAAIDAGIFAEYGLEVTVQTTQGGAQAMPALVNGDVDLSIGQPFGVLRAVEQGLDVKIIANYAESYAEGDDINAVVAAAGSGITRPADLAGKNVAVNSLGAAGDLTIRAAVEEDGGDPDAINFVEVAFPDAQAQLEAGNIDAAWVPEPFVSRIIGAGGTVVVFPYQAVLPGLPTLVIQVTGATVADDPELVAAVREAFAAAFEWSADNDDAVRQALVDNLEIPAEAAAGIPLPNFTTTINRDVLDGLAQLGVDYGYFTEKPDLSAAIAD